MIPNALEQTAGGLVIIQAELLAEVPEPKGRSVLLDQRTGLPSPLDGLIRSLAHQPLHHSRHLSRQGQLAPGDHPGRSAVAVQVVGEIFAARHRRQRHEGLDNATPKLLGLPGVDGLGGGDPPAFRIDPVLT